MMVMNDSGLENPTMPPDFIRSVTEADFEYEVIAFSRQTPVVVDFWAEWCNPCRPMGSLLERLAEEAAGSFRLAKLDVDASPNLALRFSVRSIPAVKAFRDGQVVSEFVGAQPEPRVRDFLRSLAPSQTDLFLEKGQSLLDIQAWSQAEGCFRQFLAKNHNHPAGLLGVLKTVLMQGRIAEAYSLLGEIPVSREYSAAETIRPFLEALNSLQRSPAYGENPLEAAYLNSLLLVLRGNVPAALDGMLDILRQEKHFRNGEVRKVILGLFETLGENSRLTQQYRRELAMVLF
jgi:putative thioredoxin